MVEGPSSFNRWIEHLNNPDCVPPVAVLTATNEKNGSRESAFYPFCRYSPEWVAIASGREVGAKVQFADLELTEKRSRSATPQEEPKPTSFGVLLSDDRYFHSSDFIANLVRRLGCRDFDEAWERLFETNDLSTEELVGRLATYCDCIRTGTPTDDLIADQTLAREAEMLEVVRSEFRRLKKPTKQASIVVVTGGMHTIALWEAFGQRGNPHRLSERQSPPESWLIRYSYDQLDSLSGYGSGMPSPGFYDAVFDARQTDDPERSRRMMASFVAQIARRTRGQAIAHEASVTDAIAAVEMMEQLASLRGHARPTRYDLLDAISACMQKESAVGNSQLRAIADAVLGGDRVGVVPQSAGQPPIISDFEQQTKSFRLPCGVLKSKSLQLDMYRRPEHRRMSFLFQQLRVLDVPYATFVDGPDFINGYHLNRLREEWSVAWSLNTEAGLIRAAMLGDRVATAAESRLVQSLQNLEEDASSRDASVAVDLLLQACRCGLHHLANRIANVVESDIAADPNFATVAAGMSKLQLLHSAREPLEATRLAQLPQLISFSYQRSCRLLDTLAHIPDELLEPSLKGLLSLRESLVQLEVELDDTESDSNDGEATPHAITTLDDSLYFDALQRLIASEDDVRSEICGATAGILYSAGYMPEAEVCRVVARFLNAAVEDTGVACGAVRGLMMTARECLWQMDSLLQSLDRLLTSWEEERFHKALPSLRIAFSGLAPKEIDEVAAKVATLHDVDDIGSLIHPDITEEELQLGLQLNQIAKQSLQRDGLL